MKVLVQNLHKRSGLATQLVQDHQPDVLLAQEINLFSELVNVACNTSRLGYGTALYASHGTWTNIRQVQSPHAEMGGIVRKKTIIAHWSGVDWVSFHGYNGQPQKNIAKLLDHVRVVLEAVQDSPHVVWAGDWNTWSAEHWEAVRSMLANHGFQWAGSWPYPGTRKSW